MLATYLKGEALDVYKSLHIDDRKVYDTVKEKSRNAFKPEDIFF